MHYFAFPNFFAFQWWMKLQRLKNKTHAVNSSILYDDVMICEIWKPSKVDKYFTDILCLWLFGFSMMMELESLLIFLKLFSFLIWENIFVHQFWWGAQATSLRAKIQEWISSDSKFEMPHSKNVSGHIFDRKCLDLTLVPARKFVRWKDIFKFLSGQIVFCPKRQRENADFPSLSFSAPGSERHAFRPRLHGNPDLSHFWRSAISVSAPQGFHISWRKNTKKQTK